MSIRPGAARAARAKMNTNCPNRASGHRMASAGRVDAGGCDAADRVTDQDPRDVHDPGRPDTSPHQGENGPEKAQRPLRFTGPAPGSPGSAGLAPSSSAEAAARPDPRPAAAP